MTDPNNTANEEEPLRDITLEPGIYDFTPQIRDHIANGTPFPDEMTNVLRTFEYNYDFDEDIKRRGKDILLGEMDLALKVFDFEDAKQAINEGLALAQAINPDIKIEPFPTVFLYIPHRGDAKSLHGQGCAINIEALEENQFSNGTPHQKIVSFAAHEDTHMIVRQLEKQMPERVETRKDEIYSFMWEEGLTTYIEPMHYRHHYPIFEDAHFWVKTISTWLDTDDANVKKQLYAEIKDRPSFTQWFSDMWGSRRTVPEEINDYQFSQMLKQCNGPAYHVGAYLWKKQIEKGNSLKDLVMAGYGNMNEWIKEETRDI